MCLDEELAEYLGKRTQKGKNMNEGLKQESFKTNSSLREQETSE